MAKTLDKDTARAPLIDFKGKNAKIAPMLQCNVAQTAISADNGPAKPYRMRVSEDRVVLTGFHERDWVKLGKDFPTMCGVVLTGFHERDWVKLGKDFPTMCGVVLTGFHERDWVAGWACRRRQKILAGGCRFNQVKAGGLYGRKRSTPDTPAAE
ncbi:hypothetical protein [Orrella sp. 11846]|uniref:hypothetical protein n=1 Tax=Orrella sp. 11846 TaxID=3409913 RepID=UPI003B5A05E2